jgi:nitrite reductase/ring-hydroxylating ferredoxin subunit
MECPEPAWQRVASLAELPSGGRRIVEYDGCRVLLLNVGGDLFAFESLCPHQEFPLDDCDVYEGRIECPYHGYSYWLETGENDYPASVFPADLPYLRAQLRPLTRFRVRIDSGEIRIAPEDG